MEASISCCFGDLQVLRSLGVDPDEPTRQLLPLHTQEVTMGKKNAIEVEADLDRTPLLKQGRSGAVG